MNNKSKSKVCNLCLIAVGALTLLSSIQMEVCGGKGLWGLSFTTFMYLHCGLGTLMFILVAEHLYLHFGNKNWITKMKSLKKQTKWLCTIFAVLLPISVVAFVRIVTFPTHTPIGAAHGKIGFLFLILCVLHTAWRWKWVKKQMFKSKES